MMKKTKKISEIINMALSSIMGLTNITISSVESARKQLFFKKK